MSPAPESKQDRLPPYQHAADELRRDILQGRIKPGEQMPAIRELQERFGVANMTMRSALNVLRDEGLIYTIHGRGASSQTMTVGASSLRTTPRQPGTCRRRARGQARQSQGREDPTTPMPPGPPSLKRSQHYATKSAHSALIIRNCAVRSRS